MFRVRSVFFSQFPSLFPHFLFPCLRFPIIRLFPCLSPFVSHVPSLLSYLFPLPSFSLSLLPFLSHISPVVLYFFPVCLSFSTFLSSFISLSFLVLPSLPLTNTFYLPLSLHLPHPFPLPSLAVTNICNSSFASFCTTKSFSLRGRTPNLSHVTDYRTKCDTMIRLSKGITERRSRSCEVRAATCGHSCNIQRVPPYAASRRGGGGVTLSETNVLALPRTGLCGVMGARHAS